MRRGMLIVIFILLTYIALPANAEILQARIVSQADGAEMSLIPAGSFIYGINQNEIKEWVKRQGTGWDNIIYPTEYSRRTITLPAFYIDRYEVTNERYLRFVQATKHRPSRYADFPQLNAPKQPVVGVGWGDAEAYCKWAGKQLPSEEQWEKAARGTDGRIWPWGNDPNKKLFNGRAAGYFAPLSVGSYPNGDSPYGVADMAGNVWEMTSGIWKDSAKTMRGGSFLNRLIDVRVTVRWAAADEESGANWLGFRCSMMSEKK